MTALNRGDDSDQNLFLSNYGGFILRNQFLEIQLYLIALIGVICRYDKG